MKMSVETYDALRERLLTTAIESVLYVGNGSVMIREFAEKTGTTPEDKEFAEEFHNTVMEIHAMLADMMRACDSNYEGE